MTTSREGRVFFYILMFLVGWATFTLLRQYMEAIVLAVVAAIVFRPVYVAIYRRVGERTGIATPLTMGTLLATILIPLLVVFLLTINQISRLSQDLATIPVDRQQLLEDRVAQVTQTLDSIPWGERLGVEEEALSQRMPELMAKMNSFLNERLLAAGLSSFEIFSLGIIFLIVVGALLAHHENIVQLLRDLSPMDDALDQLYLERLAAMAKAMTKGIVLIAIAQGVVAGILLAIGGTSYILPLTVLAMFAAILPLGVAIITVPAGLVHLVLGNTWQGALIIAASLLIISSMDNWLRPRLVSKRAYLNPPLVLLSVFAGISLFGFFGVIYGPIIMILFVTTLEVYLNYYRHGATPLPSPSSTEKD